MLCDDLERTCRLAALISRFICRHTRANARGGFDHGLHLNLMCCLMCDVVCVCVCAWIYPCGQSSRRKGIRFREGKIIPRLHSRLFYSSLVSQKHILPDLFFEIRLNLMSALEAGTRYTREEARLSRGLHCWSRFL